jgi:HD-GYP domain-containing protein (c-di-GMP phosphodiesterase class II)
MSRLRWAPKTVATALAAAAAVTGGLAAYAIDAWPRVENESVDLRFAARGTQPAPSDLAVVSIDDKTFSELQLQWPFPRSLHGALIKRLRADGASTIVYDVQFTEPSSRGPADDLALYEAIRRAGNVVLASTEVDSAGHTNVLGGAANLRRAHAVAAAANLPAEAGGVIRRYAYAPLPGLASVAAVAANRSGHPISPARFTDGKALIDFRGPPGTISTLSFSDVLRGRVSRRALAGKIVVVGASVPTLQDLHPTSTTSARPMAGPEIQANAIWTALRGNPLKPAQAWLAIVAVLLGGAVAPLLALRWSLWISALASLVVAGAYVVLAQVAFDSGTVLVLTYPLAAWALGEVGMVVASYVGAFVERNAFSRMLRDSQLELIQRLAHAVGYRDRETGEHIQRIGVLCERLALAIGWTPAQAEVLRHASKMHDVGKIAVPDRILLNPGGLDAEEWEIVKTHAAVGGEILGESANPLVRLAQTIALSHHERWDGGGYPAGLKGEEIPLAARICAVCDLYDALLSERPYKDSWSVQQALQEVRRMSGSKLDPRLVQAFIEIAPGLSDQLASIAAPADARKAARPRTA